MKLKEYFLKLKTQGKITNEEFDKSLETLADTEIPDQIISALDDKFLTRERAVTDKEIYRRVYAEALNGVDSTISNLLPTLASKSDQVAISGEVDTFKKLKMLDAAYKRQYEELKKTAPDANKLNEEYQKNVRELTEKLESAQGEKEKVISEMDTKIKEVTSQKEKELKQFKLRTDITGKLAQIEFAKEFTENPKVKETVFNGILNSVFKNDLDYDDQGHIAVQEIVNGVPKPKFFPGTNDQVTIEKLLETETSPYLKRNNSDGNGSQQNTNPITKVTSGTQKSGQTLAQKRSAAALSE
jgi:hypothetical protein